MYHCSPCGVLYETELNLEVWGEMVSIRWYRRIVVYSQCLVLCSLDLRSSIRSAAAAAIRWAMDAIDFVPGNRG